MFGRHLAVVFFSSVVGSAIGTLIIEVLFRAAGEPSRVGSVLAIGGVTLLFTLPGCVLLMALTFPLADRRISFPEARVALVVVGTVTGAAMLGLGGGNPVFWAPVGALYGAVTSIAFVGLLALFGAYRPLSR